MGASPVTLQTRGRIGVVVIDNPPVNAISLAVVQGLIAGLDAFERDSSLQALVLHCAGRTWVAGGDISAFDDPEFSAAPLNLNPAVTPTRQGRFEASGW